MIVVRVELWPLGDESVKEDLGTAIIMNDGSGDVRVGAYDVRLMKGAKYSKQGGVWKRGRVERFYRRLGPWHQELHEEDATLMKSQQVAALPKEQ